MPESPTSSDRALRALADTLGESRARRPEDGADPDIPVAATVLILRDGPGGAEVLMIERPDRGSFAGAWVFPGGKVDAADAVDGPAGDTTTGEMATAETATAEAEEHVARRAGVRETWEETGLVVDEASLVTLSCWDPPPGLPLRIRTWFFAVEAPAGELALSADEAVSAEWMRPAEVLERHGRGELTLYPPTWVTLHGLRDQPTVHAIIASIRIAGLRRFETVARRLPTGPILLWQEDSEYEADAATAATARHRIEVGALPWIYTRTD